MTFLSRSPITNSRRSLLILCLSGMAFLVGVMVVKDLNQKLDVMTSSNSEYQSMTDRQSDQLKRLQQKLREEEKGAADSTDRGHRREQELKAKLEKLEKKAKAAEGELSKVRGQYDSMSRKLDAVASEQAETNHRLSRADAESTKWQSEASRLSAKVNAYEEEKARLQAQYLALFKQQQQSDDAIQYLTAEKERLQLQLVDAEKTASKSSSKSPVLQHPQIQPMMSSPDRSGAKSSTPRTSHRQQANIIAEPFHPQRAGHPIAAKRVGGAIRSSSTRAANVVKAAPVAAEPPHVVAGQHHVAAHEVNREDVMEAPNLTGGQRTNGNHVGGHFGQSAAADHFGDYLHQFQLAQQPVVKQYPGGVQHAMDRPQHHHQQQLHFVHGNDLNSQFVGQQEQPVRALPRRKQQHHHLQQQKHSFVRPNSVRFQRREIDGGGANQRDNKFELGNPKLAGGEEEDQFMTGDEDEDAEDEDETADGGVDAQVPVGSHSTTDMFTWNRHTGRSNCILHRKWKYSLCCWRDVILKIERDLLNSILQFLE